MKVLVRKVSGALLDLRVIVGLGGALLSVVAHELFHIIVHWGEIESIRIFPNPLSVVEVSFIPLGEYDVVFEEAIAYGITILVLLLTTMLICEIHDIRDSKSAKQTLFGKRQYEADELMTLDQLGVILGIGPTGYQPKRDTANDNSV